ncbi:Bax inhibitor-1/YccA family protein [Oceanimonas baumannii]|uniref:BAX inhibitor protein n=1 Tax=Oceanimonas baumannii TaxID=129578 RepID=A0A235CKU8_9GAMM|nr:Bax inhibitor-1/YccA family protein [Oceanimonas baumannii]OYD25228.1 BAX inhibitor protein [Oceanimonas baumannii]TDW62478.1 modulator of FtsH protease [Oceanimonas baumannii]
MRYNNTLSRTQSGALETNKVLRNTYMLLGMTLVVASLSAGISAMMNLPHPGLIITLVGFYGLMYLTERNRNSGLGLLFIFAFTAFTGYTIGPILNYYLSTSTGTETVMLALGGTALTFLALSAYVLTTKKDMSFLGGMMMAGFVVILVGFVANIFLALPALSLALSALFILFSSGAILMQTSAIIHGGEQNYISATVTLYVSIFNIFLSLLQLLGMSRD